MYKKIGNIVAWTESEVSHNQGLFGIVVNEEKNLVYSSTLRIPAIFILDGRTNKYSRLIKLTNMIGNSSMGLGGIACNPLTNRIYVTSPFIRANFGSNKICVVDTTQEKYVKEIPIIDGPRGIGVDSKNGLIFIAQYGSGWYGGANTVTVLDENEELVKKITVDTRPWELTIEPFDGMTYVSCKGNSLYKHGTLYVIKNKNLEVVKKISIGRRPRVVGVNHRLKKAYVTCRFDCLVYVLDIQTSEVIKRISTDCDPIGVVVNEALRKTYIINRQGIMRLGQPYAGQQATVLVLDANDDKVVKRIPLQGKTAHYGSLNRKTNLMYVTCEDSNNINVIDTEKDEVVKVVQIGRSVDNMTINPATGYIYAPSHISDEVSVIDGRNNKFVNAFPVEDGWPERIIFEPRTNHMYILSGDKGTITVVDSSTFEVIKKYDLGIGSLFSPGEPMEEGNGHSRGTMAIDSLRKKIYVTCPPDDCLAIIDIERDKVHKTYLGWQAGTAIDVNRSGSTHPTLAVAINERTNIIYVYNTLFELLTIIDGDTYEIKDRLDIPLPEPEGDGMFYFNILINKKNDIMYIGRTVYDLNNRNYRQMPIGPGDIVSAIDQEKGRLYILDRKNECLNIIDSNSYRIIETIKLEKPVTIKTQITVDPEMNKFYVLRYQYEPISAFQPEIDVYEGQLD